MSTGHLIDEALTQSIIGAFFRTYNRLGFGFLESICCAALERELRDRGHVVQREVSVSVWYKGRQVGCQKLDMLVDGRVIVEVKSAAILHRSATRQLYNYLRATDLRIGLFFHFGREPNFERVFCATGNRQSSPIDPAVESG